MSDNDRKSDLERSFEALSLELEPVQPPAADSPDVSDELAAEETRVPGVPDTGGSTSELSLQLDGDANPRVELGPAEPIVDERPQDGGVGELTVDATTSSDPSSGASVEPELVDAVALESFDADESIPSQAQTASEPSSPVSLAPAALAAAPRSLKLKTVVTDLGHRMFGEPVGIAISASVLLACAALMLWSVFVRLDVLDEVVALEMQELELSATHGSLTLELSQINQDAVRSEIEEQNARIFNGFPAVASWVERLSGRAEGMNMNVRYRVGDPVMAPIADVLEVPVVIEFEVASEDDGGLFTRGMALVESLLDDHWHLDIASTEASGDGKGLRTLELEARLWVFDNEEFLAPQLLVDNGDVAALEMSPDAEFVQ